jgi:hypothetical protein
MSPVLRLKVVSKMDMVSAKATWGSILLPMHLDAIVCGFIVAASRVRSVTPARVTHAEPRKKLLDLLSLVIKYANVIKLQTHWKCAIFPME